jgi:hypothetical protein
MPRWVPILLIAIIALCLGLSLGRSQLKRQKREGIRQSWDSAYAMTNKRYTLVPGDGMVFYNLGNKPTKRLTIELGGSGGGGFATDYAEYEAAGFRQLGLVDVTNLKTSGHWGKPAEVVKNFLDQVQSQDPAWRDANFLRTSSPTGEHDPTDTGSIGVIRHDYAVITLVAYPSSADPNLLLVVMSSRVTDRLADRK